MLRHILWFEVRYWLRSWTLWIFLLVVAASIFGAASTDQVVVGASLSNTHRNAPFVIQNFYSIIGLLTLLMAAAFVSSAVTRDFSHNTHQILFATPLRRFDFLVGRFLGATLVSIVPMLGVSVGMLLARQMPWVDPARWGPVDWTAHARGIAVFAVPNAVITAAILFAIAVLARRDAIAFVGGFVLLAGYTAADAFVLDLERERIAAWLDPFGVRTFALATKYWTVADKNGRSLGLEGLLLWNRLLWLAVAAAVFLFACSRFRFAERARRGGRRQSPPEPAAAAGAVPLPAVRLAAAPWRCYLAATRIQVLETVRSTAFVVILLAALLNTVPNIVLSAREGYGNRTLPVTYWILEIIASSLYLFLVVLITYYAGVLVWKDRETRMDEIVDALPAPGWIAFASRLTAVVGIVAVIQLLALGTGLAVQAAYGYHRFQLGLYLQVLLVRDGSGFLAIAVLALFIHAVSPNKYVGYFVYIALLVANVFIWRPLNVATYLVRFAGRPPVIYSDFFGDAPFRGAWGWFTAYWLLFCGLLAIAAVMFWPRGKQLALRERWRAAGLRFGRGWRSAALAGLAALAAAGGWIAYNTMVRNPLLGPRELERRRADYERSYRPLRRQPMPRVRSVSYVVELDPESRSLRMKVDQLVVNPYPRPLDEIHFTLDRRYDTAIEVPGAVLARDDARLSYRIYRFEPPLAPGEQRTLRFTVQTRARGFENEVGNLELVQNGTFFNNRIAPMIGYDSGRELGDPNERRRHGLGEQELMPPLERDCRERCDENYLGGHADWVDAETRIGTAPDQIAVAPGALLREWRENGRRWFHYKLERPSLNFHSFASARYAVARESWNGIALEVYYQAEHAWNVPRMLEAMRRSLEYFTREFGPYPHRQARIVEFPRVARFAQAFAGTMPYSESIGFIANLNHPDDIDNVAYVVAHELGHQWWAHQVVGAEMQGATVLSETLAQYSALMVMEKQQGRASMRKFLRYEMDRYLAGRGRERLKERPLVSVESGQGYIHYQKGSVALYHLKEMIGEAAVNRALRGLIRRYGYAPPPYPTSWALVDALRAETPAELQPLITDLFEDITVFSNRALAATARRRPDGRYDVTVELEAHKFKADAAGNETEVGLDDWIEIGAFARREPGQKYGRTLHRQRVRLQAGTSTHVFTVDELPGEAGIDPFLLLIDRVPEDNMKKVTASAQEPAREGAGPTPRGRRGSGTPERADAPAASRRRISGRA